MKLVVAAVAALLTAGCVVTRGPRPGGDDPASSGVVAIEPEPDYAEARAKLDAAQGELAGDPAAAARDFLAARAALFRAFADMHKQQGRPTALFQALGVGSERIRHFGPAANEVFWRSIIGRTAALKTLGREPEALTELPRWQVEAGVGDGAKTRKLLPATKLCPPALASACADHVAWLQGRFPQVRVGESGPFLEPDLTIASNENDLDALPNIVKKLPDQPIVFALRIAGLKREKDGAVTLLRDGAELGTISGTDTGKRRIAVEGERVVVEKVMTNVQHDVAHSNSISIHLAPEQDFSRNVRGGDILVYANVRKARSTREGPRVRYHLDKPLVISFAGLYQYGVDLAWAWPPKEP